MHRRQLLQRLELQLTGSACGARSYDANAGTIRVTRAYMVMVKKRFPEGSPRGPRSRGHAQPRRRPVSSRTGVKGAHARRRSGASKGLKTPLSRQRRWQLARIAEGRCAHCGKPRRHYPTICDQCALARRRRHRLRAGSKPWKPGGAGRPPVLAERGRTSGGKPRQSGGVPRSRRGAPSGALAGRRRGRKR